MNYRRVHRFECAPTHDYHFLRHQNGIGGVHPSLIEKAINTALKKSEKITGMVYDDGYVIVFTDDYGCSP